MYAKVRWCRSKRKDRLTQHKLLTTKWCARRIQTTAFAFIVIIQAIKCIQLYCSIYLLILFVHKYLNKYAFDVIVFFGETENQKKEWKRRTQIRIHNKNEWRKWCTSTGPSSDPTNFSFKYLGSFRSV